jgi:hypothetical protein
MFIEQVVAATTIAASDKWKQIKIKENWEVKCWLLCAEKRHSYCVRHTVSTVIGLVGFVTK